MRAIVIEGVGGPEVLHVREVETPEPGADQVRVRVRAAGVNRADLMQARDSRASWAVTNASGTAAAPS